VLLLDVPIRTRGGLGAVVLVLGVSSGGHKGLWIAVAVAISVSVSVSVSGGAVAFAG
jgi:hypothetical protein